MSSAFMHLSIVVKFGMAEFLSTENFDSKSGCRLYLIGCPNSDSLPLLRILPVKNFTFCMLYTHCGEHMKRVRSDGSMSL